MHSHSCDTRPYLPSTGSRGPSGRGLRGTRTTGRDGDDRGFPVWLLDEERSYSSWSQGDEGRGPDSQREGGRRRLRMISWTRGVGGGPVDRVSRSGRLVVLDRPHRKPTEGRVLRNFSGTLVSESPVLTDTTASQHGYQSSDPFPDPTVKIECLHQ